MNGNVRGKKVDVGDFLLYVYVSIPDFEIGLQKEVVNAKSGETSHY